MGTIAVTRFKLPRKLFWREGIFRKRIGYFRASSGANWSFLLFFVLFDWPMAYAISRVLFSGPKRFQRKKNPFFFLVLSPQKLCFFNVDCCAKNRFSSFVSIRREGWVPSSDRLRGRKRILFSLSQKEVWRSVITIFPYFTSRRKVSFLCTCCSAPSEFYQEQRTSSHKQPGRTLFFVLRLFLLSIILPHNIFTKASNNIIRVIKNRPRWRSATYLLIYQTASKDKSFFFRRLWNDLSREPAVSFQGDQLTL